MRIHTNLPIEMKPKLVRDKIPQIIEQHEIGVKPLTRILDDKEYGERLIEKIHEEAEELSLAIKEKTNSVEELADVLEVVNAIADYIGSSIGEVEIERLKKLVERGGFKGRIMLEGKQIK
jgi:predicted house-cleaning noncanonical NTP pyrophosphatase (MazG superfamily)